MVGLIWLAESNRPELVEPHYYTAGSIDSVKRETLDNRTCGWKPIVHYNNNALIISLRDSAGKPVSGISIGVALYRPSSDLLDRPEQEAIISDSSYTLTMQPPLKKGLWSILLVANSHDGKRLRSRIPLFVE